MAGLDNMVNKDIDKKRKPYVQINHILGVKI